MTKLLCWRTFTEQRRNIPAITVKLISAIIYGLLIGGLYSNIGYKQKSIQNRFGSLFFVCINQVMNSFVAVLNTFPSEKALVNRERSGRAYNTLQYFLAKLFVEMPLNLAPCVVFSTLTYWYVSHILRPI